MGKPDWVKAEESRQKSQVDAGQKPDWMLEEESRQADIAAMPRKTETGPAPKYLPVTTGAKVAATIGAGLQAPARLGAGLLQLAGINAPAEATEATSQYLKGIAGFPASVAETVGETVPQMALPITRPLMMAAQGATTGIAQPNVDQASLGSYPDMLLNKARQGLEGGALGGLFGKLSQAALKPNVSPDLQKLQEMGMTRFTPGQLLSDVPLIGQGLQRAEQAATSLPLTGSMIRKGLQTTNEDFNRAMAQKVLDPMGIQIGKDVPAGRTLVDFLEDTIGTGYDAIKGKIDFKNVIDPKTKKSTYDHMMEHFTDIARDKTIGQQRIIFDEFDKTFLQAFQRNKHLNGDEFREIEKSLGNKAKAYMRDPVLQDVGFALRDIQNAMRNELAYQNPAVGKELRNLHEAFKRYLRVERAASYIGAQEGVYSPSQMQSAVKAVGGQRPFATGRAMFQPETQAALKVMGPTMPDSGTAGRQQVGDIVRTGLDLGAQVASTGAPLIASAGMYNPLAQKLLTNLATKRPQYMGPMQPFVSRGAAALGGTTTNTNQGALP
jgi:hypothetical protein